MDNYILQKDLPDVKAGAIFSIGAATDAYYLTTTRYNCYIYPICFVENNPEWFKKQSKQPTKDKEYDILSISFKDWLLHKKPSGLFGSLLLVRDGYTVLKNGGKLLDY